MKTAILFGLLAMLPVAFNPAPRVERSSQAYTARICSGDGRVHSVAIPGSGQDLPRDGNQPCCAKACHGGHSRKRFMRTN